MDTRTEKKIIKAALFVSVTILIIAVLSIVTRQKPSETTDYSSQHSHDSDNVLPQKPAIENTEQSAGEDNILKPTLKQITRSARGWGEIYKYWHGETAPDITLTDITGKVHKLSDYRGKNVLINFWASWCAPCLIEIPHLITLRNTISRDKFAILAISDEPLNLVKIAAERYNMNYSVFSADSRRMPRPYRTINSLPTNIFITPQGKIKFITTGQMPLRDIKAILQAER